MTPEIAPQDEQLAEFVRQLPPHLRENFERADQQVREPAAEAYASAVWRVTARLEEAPPVWAGGV